MSNVRESVEAGVEAMLEHMRDDYIAWSGKGSGSSKIRTDMEKDYQDSLVEKSKYEPSQRSKV